MLVVLKLGLTHHGVIFFFGVMKMIQETRTYQCTRCRIALNRVISHNLDTSLKDCELICGDETEGVVRWKSGSDLSLLEGRVIRLRFVMQDADLYALQFR